MNVLVPERIHDVMCELSSAPPSVFGADRHRFELNPVLPEKDVSAFERAHRISLPEDYRSFICRIGNGGAGPYYGVFPLGQVDDGNQLSAWQERDGLVGILSKPFPFKDAWNDTSQIPNDELTGIDESEFERRVEAFQAEYWSSEKVNGAIPICHEGCAIRIWLVVTGDEAGHLWRDGRSEHTGLSPLRTPEGSRVSFSRWYQDWLGAALASSPNSPE